MSRISDKLVKGIVNRDEEIVKMAIGLIEMNDKILLQVPESEINKHLMRIFDTIVKVDIILIENNKTIDSKGIDIPDKKIRKLIDSVPTLKKMLDDYRNK